MTDTSHRFFGGLANLWKDPRVQAAMADVSSGDPKRVEAGARVVAENPPFNAMMRNGIAPTMLSAGVRPNVIPAEASATLNVRLIPGQSLEDLIVRLKASIADDDVQVTVEDRGDESPPSPDDTPMFAAIREAVAA